jgi:hypothetical protein
MPIQKSMLLTEMKLEGNKKALKFFSRVAGRVL